MIEFADSTELLEDHDALRSRFEEDGYVFLKGAVDRELLLDLRRRVTSICKKHGWLRRGTDRMDAIASDHPCLEEDPRYYDVYDDVQKLEAFHAVPHHPSVRACMTALLGETAFPHPLSIARLMFPDNSEFATPPHQDHPNNQGTQDLYACWMPLSDCPIELGGLTILRGSHRLGVLPLEFSLGAGNRQAKLDERFQRLEWVGGDFELGDTVIFHSLTVHRALPNTSERLRISVDYRFQREGEPLTETCLQPHFRRMSWDEIYRGWKRSDLQYYWRDRQYTVVPWNESFHELSEAEVQEAERVYQDAQRRRQERFRGATSKRGLLRRLRSKKPA